MPVFSSKANKRYQLVMLANCLSWNRPFAVYSLIARGVGYYHYGIVKMLFAEKIYC